MENEFSTFLRFMRKAAGLSTSQLALKMGLSKSTISNYEAGIKVPDNTDYLETKLRKIVKEEIKLKRMNGGAFNDRTAL